MKAISETEKTIWKELMKVGKKNCCVCGEKLAGYSWAGFQHKEHKTWSVRIHAGECFRAFKKAQDKGRKQQPKQPTAEG